MNVREIDKANRDLHTALKSLSDQSLKTSRRLDDTYYSILEKVSVLRQTIGSLQELSGLTKELHENFESDTKELLDDVQGQIDGFGAFDSQQKQIVDMEERVKAGKNKADSLTERLARAKDRVDARARSEVEWEAKHIRTSLLIAALQYLLTLPHRSRTHFLGHRGLNSHPGLRSGHLPSHETAQCHARSGIYARLRLESAYHGSAHTGHCERSHNWTNDKCGHRGADICECCAFS
jgi:hypothetical protein